MPCGALGPVFTNGLCGISIDGAESPDELRGESIDGPESPDEPWGESIDGADGMSIDDPDDIDDDPESLGPDGDGPGSLGAIGNGPDAGKPAGIGYAPAFAIGGPNRIRFTSMPVAIAAVRIRCFVVTV
jgi:hypothetical protein